MSDEIARPRTPGDCASVPRACPFVGCLEVNPATGHVRFAWTELEPDEVANEGVAFDHPHRLAGDAAERGAHVFERHPAAVGNVERARGARRHHTTAGSARNAGLVR